MHKCKVMHRHCNVKARHFQFDYSAMNEDNLWYLKTIQNTEIRDEIISVAN